MVASAQGKDVSNYQGKVDWATLGKGLAFAFCKATEGTTFEDAEFAANWAGIKSAGLYRGAYHFLHPADSATAQAQYFMNMVKAHGLLPGDMLVCDAEVTDGLADASVNSSTKAFCDEVMRIAGPHCPVIVYTYASFAAKLPGCTGFPLWIAYPSNAAPASVAPWKTWKFWQWGTVSGIDADAFNGTDAELTAWIRTYTEVPVNNLGGKIVGGVTSVRWDDGDTVAAGVGVDGHVWAIRWHAGSWGTWQKVSPTSANGAPGMIAFGTGLGHLYYAGSATCAVLQLKTSDGGASWT